MKHAPPVGDVTRRPVVRALRLPCCPMRRRIVVAVVAVNVALASSCGGETELASEIAITEPSVASPTSNPAAKVSASNSAPPTTTSTTEQTTTTVVTRATLAPAASTTLVPENGPLAPGTYTLVKPERGHAAYDQLIFTLPAGWAITDGLVHKHLDQVDEMAFSTWIVTGVYDDPCHWRTSTRSEHDLAVDRVHANFHDVGTGST